MQGTGKPESKASKGNGTIVDKASGNGKNAIVVVSFFSSHAHDDKGSLN